MDYKLHEQLNRMRTLIGLKENKDISRITNNIKIHIPEVIRKRDVSNDLHPAIKYGSGNIRYIKLDDLIYYREFDRSKGDDNSLNNIEKLKESFLENGFTEGNELIMNYYYNDYNIPRVILIEGNHRLVAAKDLGMDFLPVRINAYRSDSPKGKRVISPFEIDNNLCKEYSYYPSSVDASMVFDDNALITGYLKGIDNI